MKILVTGGCGYTGSVLIPKLLKLGHKVICIDTMWFGNFLEKNKNLTICKNDIRNIDKINLKGVNALLILTYSNKSQKKVSSNKVYHISPDILYLT